MDRAEPFPYRIEILYSQEDGCYVARVPALRGCMAHGETPEEATREARIAAAAILKTMQDHGDPLPAADHLQRRHVSSSH